MNPNISRSNAAPSNDEIREILVQRINHQKQAVGIAVGVVEPGGRRIVAHGHLSNGDSREVDGDTIFEIGSATKVFTSLLLADMVQRKEVALDYPAQTLLPAHVTMPMRSGRAITLVDLATHTSGLPRLPANLKPQDPRNPYSGYGVEELYAFLSSHELQHDPGAQFEYSNLGGGLLGHLLALRLGVDYETAIRTRITQPLGMAETSLALSPSMQQRMATGHTAMLAPTASWDVSALAGAGGLRSSANDVATFLEAFLGHRESPLAAAMKAMTDVRRPAGKLEIGLGWLITQKEGRELVFHDGGTGGFRSFVGFDPQRRVGVVVMSNAFTLGGVDDIGFHLLNPKVPLATPEAPQQRTEIAVDPEILDRYTGRYRVMPTLVMEITREGDRLFAQAFVQPPAGELVAAPRFEVFAESETKFFAKVTDKQITFEVGPSGRADGFVLHSTGRPDMAAARA